MLELGAAKYSPSYVRGLRLFELFPAAAAFEGEFRLPIRRPTQQVVRHVGFPIDFALVVGRWLAVVVPFNDPMHHDA